MRMKRFLALLLAAAMTMSLAACGSAQSGSEAWQGQSEDAGSYDGQLVFDHSMELKYAANFSVDYYKGGYKLLKSEGNDDMLVVPEGMSVPSGLAEGTYVVQQPLSNILVSSTPVTSLFTSFGMLDAITMTTTQLDTWYVDTIKEQMNQGKMKYIGEYKAPDYEAIIASGCSFSIFSGMLTDDVKEQLGQIGVHTMVDGSSNESHPLGRVEWMKFYAALFDKEAEAESAFAQQEAIVETLSAKENTGKSVAVFYITTSGALYARNSDDYMAKMVSLAGGSYVLDGKVGVGKSGTAKMEMEAFFEGAKDADVIIYIWSTGGKPATLEELVAKSEILADMKAVKEGNVWCTTPDFFQVSNTLGNMMEDINKALNADESQDSFTYLFKLK